MLNASLHALEAFTRQNPELEQLERLLGQFNIFEALGAARHELRHSDFLAFLLNPAQNHGLGAAFLQSFLQEVGLTINEGLSAVDVRREWGHIDILIIDSTARRVMLIENKIDTGEHSDQLARYYETVQRTWPDYNILALYLTPDGTEPSDERYQAVGYDAICRVVEEVAECCQSSLDPAVHLLMTHYAKMLRKHIVSDSDISELCRRIYKEHHQALDLIYKHRPDWRTQVADILARMADNYPDWNFSAHGSGYQNCRPREWDTTYALGDVLYCQFQFGQQNRIDFVLYIWQVDTDPDTCRNLWEMAQRLGWSVGRFNTRNTPVHRFPLLQGSGTDLESAELEAHIHNKWNDLLETQYPKLQKQLQGEKWLWEEGYTPPVRPLRQNDVGIIAKRLVEAKPNLLTLNIWRHAYCFCPKEWAQNPVLYQESLPEIQSLLYLAFEIEPHELNFLVQIRKGPEQEHVRQKLYQMAEREHWPGMDAFRKKWITVYKLPVLVAADYQSDHAKLQSLIEDRWTDFIEQHLPTIMETVRQEEWLWNNDNETSR